MGGDLLRIPCGPEAQLRQSFVVSATPSNYWNCPRCTYENHMDFAYCAMCNTKRPENSTTAYAPPSPASKHGSSVASCVAACLRGKHIIALYYHMSTCLVQ